MPNVVDGGFSSLSPSVAGLPLGRAGPPSGARITVTTHSEVADMEKRIAILVRERQEEALRMAVGMILLDDVIHIYVLDRPVADNPENALYLETIRDLELGAWSTVVNDQGLATITLAELAKRLPTYDHVLAY